jgi:hypothetical protein
VSKLAKSIFGAAALMVVGLPAHAVTVTVDWDTMNCGSGTGQTCTNTSTFDTQSEFNAAININSASQQHWRAFTASEDTNGSAPGGVQTFTVKVAAFAAEVTKTTANSTTNINNLVLNRAVLGLYDDNGLGVHSTYNDDSHTIDNQSTSSTTKAYKDFVVFYFDNNLADPVSMILKEYNYNYGSDSDVQFWVGGTKVAAGVNPFADLAGDKLGDIVNGWTTGYQLNGGQVQSVSLNSGTANLGVGAYMIVSALLKDNKDSSSCTTFASSTNCNNDEFKIRALSVNIPVPEPATALLLLPALLGLAAFRRRA